MTDLPVKIDRSCDNPHYIKMSDNIEKYYRKGKYDEEECFLDYCSVEDVGLRPSKSYPVKNVIAGKEDFYRYYKKKGNFTLSYSVWCKIVLELMKEIWLQMYSNMFVMNIRRVGRIKVVRDNNRKYMWVEEDGKKMKVPCLNLHTNGIAYKLRFSFLKKFFPTSYYTFKPYKGSKESLMGYSGLNGFIQNEAENGRTYESYAR